MNVKMTLCVYWFCFFQFFIHKHWVAFDTVLSLNITWYFLFFITFVFWITKLVFWITKFVFRTTNFVFWIVTLAMVARGSWSNLSANCFHIGSSLTQWEHLHKNKWRRGGIVLEKSIKFVRKGCLQDYFLTTSRFFNHFLVVFQGFLTIF